MAFTSVQKIRFDDVDGAGIVYYPQYFHLCHKAFEDFFDESEGFSYPQLINELHRGFPTVAIQSEFSAPLTQKDWPFICIPELQNSPSTGFSFMLFGLHHAGVYGPGKPQGSSHTG